MMVVGVITEAVYVGIRVRPVLRELKAGDIRVKVDLSGFGVGTHQLIPIVDFLPARVQKVSMLPTTVEVTIVYAPTTTPLP